MKSSGYGLSGPALRYILPGRHATTCSTKEKNVFLLNNLFIAAEGSALRPLLSTKYELLI